MLFSGCAAGLILALPLVIPLYTPFEVLGKKIYYDIYNTAVLVWVVGGTYLHSSCLKDCLTHFS